MCEQDGRKEREDYIAERCDNTLCRLRENDAVYGDYVHRRILLAEKVTPFMDATAEINMSAELQTALREYVQVLRGGQTMDELIACYRCGFGDALRVVIETGVLPDQR